MAAEQSGATPGIALRERRQLRGREASSGEKRHVGRPAAAATLYPIIQEGTQGREAVLQTL